MTGCKNLKTIGYFTTSELAKLLALIEKEGIEVEVDFDKKFAKLYKNTFGIKPAINRRGSFKMPQMGWYIIYRDEDDLRLKQVVLNSPFAYCLQG
jgi:hypothetical protein